MGVPLTPILKREQSSLKALTGRSFAIDASIELHQFLALIRKPDGTLFTDRTGRVTSHLIGLLTRTSRLVTEFRMKLAFVFDGPPNMMKKRTLEARREQRAKAEREYSDAVSQGDLSKAWSKAVMTGRVTREILDDSKRLLGLMGVPWLEALEDAEAQASYMAQNQDVWAVGSKDYDSLLYGAPRLARYLTITGREFLPAQRRVRRLVPELIGLQSNLESLRISRGQLVDVAILVGTDFNEGVHGVGPKKALSLVRKYGSIEKIPGDVELQLKVEPPLVREIFLHPKTVKTHFMRASSPDMEGMVNFLCAERDFSEQRVRQVAGLLDEAYRNTDSELSKWLDR